MNTLSDDGGWIGDDFLAELASQSVQAEPRSHDTVFMVRVQLRFRSWGLMVRSGHLAASRTTRP